MIKMDVPKLGDVFFKALFLYDKESRKTTVNKMTAATTYMMLRGIISKSTFSKINSFIEDERGMNRYLEECTDLLLELLCMDEKVKRSCPSHAVAHLWEYLNQYEIPSWFIPNMYKIRKLFPEVALVEDTLYYIIREKKILKKVLIDELTSKWQPEAGENVMEGINGLLYVHNIPIVYCSLENGYAKLYHLSRKVCYTKDAFLFGVGKEAEEIYCREEQIFVNSGGKEKFLCEYDSRCFYRVAGDAVQVYEDSRWLGYKWPYEITFSGMVRQINEKEVASLLWSEIIWKDVKDKFLLRRSMQTKIKGMKAELVPFPFSIENVEVKLTGLAQDKMITKSLVRRFQKVFRIFIDNGIDREEDITKLLLAVMKYNQLCTDDLRTILESSFLALMEQLSEQKDFWERFVQDPDSLFKEYILWDEERFHEYWKEQSYPLGEKKRVIYQLE